MLFLWFSKNQQRALMLNNIALIVSCAYLTWGQLAQATITERVKQDTQVQTEMLLVMPTPFNSVYWRVLNYQGEHYYEAFTHVGDNKPLQWTRYNNNRNLITGSSIANLKRLEWFSHGWLRFEDIDGQLQITDLRLGVAGFHPFTFAIAQKQVDHWQKIEPFQLDIDEQKQQQLLDSIKQKVTSYWSGNHQPETISSL